MPSLKPRLERLEARAPRLDHEQITEVRFRIINPDRTPTLGEDGKPLVIIRGGIGTSGGSGPGSAGGQD